MSAKVPKKTREESDRKLAEAAFAKVDAAIEQRFQAIHQRLGVVIADAIEGHTHRHHSGPCPKLGCNLSPHCSAPDEPPRAVLNPLTEPEHRELERQVAAIERDEKLRARLRSVLGLTAPENNR